MKHPVFSTVFLPLLLTVCLVLTSCTGKEASAYKGQSSGSSGTQSGSGQQTDSSGETSEPYSPAADGADTQNEAAAPEAQAEAAPEPADSFEIPGYSGSAYSVIHGNIPDFSEDELTAVSYESYGALDELGRCTACTASVGSDLMPSEERGSIGMIRPTGWHTVRYDWIDGKYLYNRCHLIGYQLTAENANENNLITGTRYMNINGMLPFENMTADYIKETGNHVLYRATPVFDGNNLLASGVHLEAESVEDRGQGILFNVFCYNIEPGVSIDYTTGESSASETAPASGDSAWSGTAGNEAAQDSRESSSAEQSQSDSGSAASGTEASGESTAGENPSEVTYIINTNTGKFHYPDCSSVSQMSEHNKQEFTGSRDELLAVGYEPCGNCNP